MYEGIATSFYATTENRFRKISACYTSRRFFNEIQLYIKEKHELCKRVAQVFEPFSAEKLIIHIRKKVAYELVMCKNIQDSYELYGAIMTHKSSRGIELPETHYTGSLILRPLIAIIWEGEERTTALR